jgi:tRNA-2-methylthio-N6-dimethylallyladenosine synthase
MEEFAFDMAFVAIYSPRPGTSGSRMKDDVPQAEKKRRLQILSDQLKENAGRRKATSIGSLQRVLIDGRVSPGIFSARTQGLVPVHVSDPTMSASIGQFIEVRITGSTPMSLAGERV